ncbi:hypothetical protein CC78DRAFT_537411 [Lojkania enalia]|uniref:Uncharacterized protein n=1 Tax=Lojkania enalia TaxID=147567 RepID=A0A9P4K0E7_9PLEO|nr:hypothetical protein CC78DRAFT_537411 [Didymosphaeria enalia]
MGDSNLLPPSTGALTPATPSGLTPNTRSEAEAALTLNSTTQTDSAAPTTALTQNNEDEAVKAYRRPLAPIRTSTNNYERALQDFQSQHSASSNLSSDTISPVISSRLVAEPQSFSESQSSAEIASMFPGPGQGVVPKGSGVGSGQTEAVKRARPTGLTLGKLGRQQSWSEQDYKHLLNAKLMGEVVEGDAAGYDSGPGEKK